jgi:hypothetical protein
MTPVARQSSIFIGNMNLWLPPFFSKSLSSPYTDAYGAYFLSGKEATCSKVYGGVRHLCGEGFRVRTSRSDGKGTWLLRLNGLFCVHLTHSPIFMGEYVVANGSCNSLNRDVPLASDFSVLRGSRLRSNNEKMQETFSNWACYNKLVDQYLEHSYLRTHLAP